MKKVTPKTEGDCMEGGPCTGMMAKSKKEPIKIYPRLRLEHQFFPEAKKQEVGKTYKVELEVKMTGLSISKFSNDSEYDITGYEFGGESKDESEEK